MIITPLKFNKAGQCLATGPDGKEVVIETELRSEYEIGEQTCRDLEHIGTTPHGRSLWKDKGYLDVAAMVKEMSGEFKQVKDVPKVDQFSAGELMMGMMMAQSEYLLGIPADQVLEKAAEYAAEFKEKYQWK